MDSLTETIQAAFNDFVHTYNRFCEREDSLITMHKQAVTKAQELAKKVTVEMMAAASQRAQLLQIVEDLNLKLKRANERLPESNLLQETQDALSELQTKHSALESDTKNQRKQISTLQQSITQLTVTKQSALEEIESLRCQVDLTTKDYARATQQIASLKEENRKGTEALEQQRHQFEVTIAMKDKIILNLKK